MKETRVELDRPSSEHRQKNRSGIQTDRYQQEQFSHFDPLNRCLRKVPKALRFRFPSVQG